MRQNWKKAQYLRLWQRRLQVKCEVSLYKNFTGCERCENEIYCRIYVHQKLELRSIHWNRICISDWTKIQLNVPTIRILLQNMVPVFSLCRIQESQAHAPRRVPVTGRAAPRRGAAHRWRAPSTVDSHALSLGRCTEVQSYLKAWVFKPLTYLDLLMSCW